MKIEIKSKIKDYSLNIQKDLFKQKDILPKNRKVFFFVDENFFGIYQKELLNFFGESKYLLIKADENNKSFIGLIPYYQQLINWGFQKGDTLATFGGGILQDISGFITSTIFRGVNWIYFPTTLLAQADSCIGSKTSINFDDHKNIIGNFNPPNMIYADVSFTSSLNQNDFNSGLGEMMKFHLLADETHYKKLLKYVTSADLRNEELLQEMILSTLMIKKSYFENDEFDTGRRNLLNYGHCFGHALEAATHFEVSHGEAVIAGMEFANLFSLRRKLMNQSIYDSINAIIRPYCPEIPFHKFSFEDILGHMKHDKKRQGKDLTIVAGKDYGVFHKYDDLTEFELKIIYDEFISKYPKRNR